MIKPLQLDRLPVFKNLFSSNIKVTPPTGTTKVNKTKNKNFNHKKENIEKIKSGVNISPQN